MTMIGVYLNPTPRNRLLSQGWFEDSGAGIKVEWWKHQGDQDNTILVIKSKRKVTSITDCEGGTWCKQCDFPKGNYHASAWIKTGPTAPGAVVTIGLDPDGFVVLTLD